MSATTEPTALISLRERLAELSDLGSIGSLLFWDQNTMMPPAAAPARAEQAATLERIVHGRLTDPGLADLLDALEPWVADLDPESAEARLLAVTRRDVEKAVRVPADLAAEITRASALGQQAWLEARASADFTRFRDAFARQVDLRHRYVACFAPFEHPYDVLLDVFEPGLTVAELRPLLERLREGLVPLVRAAADPPDTPRHRLLDGPFEVEDQRRAVSLVLEAVGFDPDGWRLDPAPHPFAQSLAQGDIRITTRYDRHDLGSALYAGLHEFGHGLYEAQIDPAFKRTPLGEPVSLGIHESQSRTWENLVGRGRPFLGWLLGQLRESLPGGFDGVGADDLFRAVNAVRPSLIRVDADETTYNLHVVLRVELEIALMEGRLEVDDLPAAWNAAVERLLGVSVPDDAQGVLQDVHWGAGMIGYFATYTLGNLAAAQLWERVRRDLDIDAQLARGEFAPLRAWLAEHVHRHGRRYTPRELLVRATGGELRIEPFLEYLEGKLVAAGRLRAA